MIVRDRLIALLAWRLRQPVYMRWLAAMALFSAAMVVRLGLGPLHGANPALTFYPAILITTVLLGWVQAVAILALSVALGVHWFVRPGMYLQPVAWTVVGGLNIAIIAGLQHLAQQLAAANERQAVLFRELQHRVANTLQSVVGTFELARLRVESAPQEAARLLNDASARIAAATDVHRRLHDPALFERGLEPILRDAVAAVVDRRSVRLHLDIAPLDLTFDQMSTITMLVIEAANNAQKHVFRHGRGANLTISLHAEGAALAVLIVQDDGPGRVATEARSSEGGLGLGILQGLAKQIGATVRVRSDRGTEIAVAFHLRHPVPGSMRRRRWRDA